MELWYTTNERKVASVIVDCDDDDDLLQDGGLFTPRGLSSRRKFFKLPPASSSKTMYFGFLSKDTPVKCTMLGWLNLLIISASIMKSVSLWGMVNKGIVLTAMGCSSLRLYLYTPWNTSPKAPWPRGLAKTQLRVVVVKFAKFAQNLHLLDQGDTLVRYLRQIFKAVEVPSKLVIGIELGHHGVGNGAQRCQFSSVAKHYLSSLQQRLSTLIAIVCRQKHATFACALRSKREKGFKESLTE